MKYLYALNAIREGRRIEAIFEQGGFDLTCDQFDILDLVSTGPVQMGDLASKRRCTPAVITSLVDRLERQNLVRRVEYEKDRRVKLILITNNGKKKIQEIAQFLSTIPQ